MLYKTWIVATLGCAAGFQAGAPMSGVAPTATRLGASPAMGLRSAIKGLFTKKQVCRLGHCVRPGFPLIRPHDILVDGPCFALAVRAELPGGGSILGPVDHPGQHVQEQGAAHGKGRERQAYSGP